MAVCNHSGAIATDGTLWMWGYNNVGQLGNETTSTTPNSTPVQIGVDSDWKKVVNGNAHTIALKNDGTIWSTGSNNNGQLGLNDTTNRNTFTQIGIDSDWVDISAGYFHSGAIKADGTLWMWGNGGQYAIGSGTTDKLIPTQVGTDTDWKEIACNYECTHAIKTDGTLWSWGYNIFGSLGLGDTTTRQTPVQVGTDTNWEDVSEGNTSVLAIKTDGTLWSWGHNDDGQLGLGDVTQRNAPVQVGTDTNWHEVSSGETHSLAIKQNGTLWSCGRNVNGQLGNGTTSSSDTLVFTQVGTGTNWNYVSSGVGFSAVLDKNNNLFMCGKNTNGELGDGTTTDRLTLTNTTNKTWDYVFSMDKDNAAPNITIISKTYPIIEWSITDTDEGENIVESKVIINGETKQTFTNPTEGATLSYTVDGASLSVGENTIEITATDDNGETQSTTITATKTGVYHLEVSPLVNSYKNKALIGRSTVNIDTTNNVMGFGTYDGNFTTTTVEDATVTPNGYDTSGNGGRKLVKLDNDWLVAVTYNSSNYTLYLHVYKPDINNVWAWSDLCYVTVNTVNGFALSSKGNKVYLMSCFAGSYVRLFDIDATTQTNTNITGQDVDTGQSALGNISLTINDAGTELHATWASKNSTYTNSFNIRYAKGTINADGTVTWGTVEQVTKMNNSSYLFQNPTVILDFNGVPTILCEQVGFTVTTSVSLSTSLRGILIIKRDTTLTTDSVFHEAWSARNVYVNSNNYIQSSPSAISVPQSINGLANGRIWVAWHGTESADSGVTHVRVSYSDDGGITFSNMEKLTSGTTHQRYPSITANKRNEIFILWEGQATVNSSTDFRVYQIKNNNSVWGSVSEVKGAESRNPSTLLDLTIDFSSPLFIYKDVTNSKVGFYGTWQEGEQTPLLTGSARYTLNTTTDEVVAWVQKDATLTVDCDINGAVATKTSNTDNTEAQFTHKLASEQTVELALKLTRASATDDVNATKILGGVS